MPRPALPAAIHLLALAVFAQGTSEFMLAGLVPAIASDLNVPIADAGLLTSAFAVGMVVGAPALAVLARRWPPRWALVAFLAVFLLAHVLGAVTASFAVLMATRLVAALTCAGFLAVALTTAQALAPTGARGRALGVLLGGTTAACVAGVPGGAVLGALYGWRAAFWAVAVLSLPALVAVLRRVPRDAAASGPRTAGAEVRVLRRPRLLVLLALAALVNGATFGSFTYLAPIATDVAGIAPVWVPGLLALFGIGSFIGVRLGGRVADGRPLALLAAGVVALLGGWAAFALVAPYPAATILLTFVQGVLSFAVGTMLISEALRNATGAPTLAGSFATAALNVGAALGPWLGGVALSAGLGTASPLWLSALLVSLALALLGAGVRTRDAQPVDVR